MSDPVVEVIYGEVLDFGYLIFMKKEDVDRRVGLMDALALPTWGEVLESTRSVSPEDYELLKEWKDDAEAADDDPCTAGSDGEWPRYWPSELMTDWIPEDIAAAFGKEVPDFTGDGPFYDFSEADEGALLKAFAQQGFHCTRDESLLTSAVGPSLHIPPRR